MCIRQIKKKFDNDESFKKEKIIRKNLGIQILRMVLCFWIIMFHCYKSNNKLSYLLHRYILHVPTFIVISFFFSFKSIYGKDFKKIISRFERLVIPYLAFPIIILVINNFCFICFKTSIFGRIFTIKDLILQYIFGRQFIAVYWFQFYLIWSTLLFTIISFFFKKKFFIMINLIGLISYALQYSNLNYMFFVNYSSLVRYSIGVFVEVLPLSVVGFIISSIDFFQIVKHCRGKTMLYSFIGLFFIFRYNIFIRIKNNNFAGFENNICSLFIFIIFYLLPLENINSEVLNICICQITNYTQGIYSLHLIVFLFLESNIKLKNIRNFGRCIFIYLISYLISFLGTKLFKKSKLIYIFV